MTPGMHKILPQGQPDIFQGDAGRANLLASTA
jgi:hypothetical protein